MKRDLYWDSLKFVLIFLVVCGHSVVIYRPEGGVNQALFNSIYTFHMPLFVFISGMFSHVNDREKYKKGIFRLLETYIVVQLIWKIPQILTNGAVTLDAVINVIMMPGFAMWYLLSLISWRLIVYLTPPQIINRNPIANIILCIFISLLGGIIPVGGEFSLQRTMSLLPFFSLGYYAKEIDIKKYIAKIPLPLAVGLLLSLFLVYFFVLNRNLGLAFIWRVPYGTKAELPAVFHFLARSFFLMAATITGAMVMRVVPTRESLSQWGRTTLYIYIILLL